MFVGVQRRGWGATVGSKNWWKEDFAEGGGPRWWGTLLLGEQNTLLWTQGGTEGLWMSCMALIFFFYRKRPFAERGEKLGAFSQGWRCNSWELGGEGGPQFDDQKWRKGCAERDLNGEKSLKWSASLESLSPRHCPLLLSQWRLL